MQPSVVQQPDAVTPVTTSLKITITNNQGQTASGTTVYLYASESDWRADNNRKGTAITDGYGIAIFSGLSAIRYYWFAERGCENNSFGTAYTVNALAANKVNTTSSTIAGTGSIKLVNSSINPYKIFINGQEYIDMVGGTNKIIQYAAIATHTLRVLQISGYALYPTDKNYSVPVSCRATTTVTFP